MDTAPRNAAPPLPPAWIPGASALSAAAGAGPRLQRIYHVGTLALLAAILALSAFLQFYRLNDYQHFQGDEGILVLAARALAVQHIFPVHGLALAVGTAHIGPLFDYLITPPLWATGFNPTAGAALNGICQVLAVLLCYALVARHTGSKLGGLAAALVLATSQEVIYYGRFLWPNMLPLLVLLILWSLLAWRQGDDSQVALLAIWLGVALQLQPTAVLLLPFLAIYVLAFRPPMPAWYHAALGALFFLVLFAPAIAHDLTHHLEETKAWLAYRGQGGAGRHALGPTVARILVLLQRLAGVHQAIAAALMGVLLLLGTVCAAAPRSRASSTMLARLLLLYSAVFLGGYLFFGEALRPHYLMPLFPVPALLVGILAGTRLQRPFGRTMPHGAGIALRGVAVLVAVALAAGNVRQSWDAHFLPDRFQITLAPHRSNLIDLGQMRQVSGFITHDARDRRFNLLFSAPDDTSSAYEALLLGAGAHLSGHATATLKYLVVQPPDWPLRQRPGWVRHLAACTGKPAHRFGAALVWVILPTPACRAATASTHTGSGR